MTTYTLSATYIERDPNDESIILVTNPSTIQLVVDDNATTFSYTIDPNFLGGFLPLTNFSTADVDGNDLGAFTFNIPDELTYSTDLVDLQLYFGAIEWGAGNVTYILDLMFVGDTDNVTHYLMQFAGDSAGIGTDISIDEMYALESTITGGGTITSGVFAPLTQIPFSALAFLLDPDADLIGGTAADDIYYVGDGSDWVDGGAGDDEIYGEAGNDTLAGGTGNDKVSGGTGDDIVSGDAGNDLLHGNAGDDTINGGEGDDRIFGGTGADTIDGGIGNDKVLGGAGDDVISGGDGDDTVLAGTGNDTLNGGDGNDMLRGQAGDDTINGDAGNDLMLGGAGHDILNGGDGNDTILGGRGNDILTGGLGDDILNGGAGADSFVFLATDGGADQINRFDVSEDHLDLSGYLAAAGITVADAADFLTQYATDTGNGVLIDFTNGDTIQLDGVSSVLDLELALIL